MTYNILAADGTVVLSGVGARNARIAVALGVGVTYVPAK